jgi:pyruvate-formate lyase-activating enzyme
LYKDGMLDIKQVEDALATQFGGKENYQNILKNFEKTLDKKHQ